MKFSWMENNSSEFSVERMCQVLNVSRSGYYAWIGRPESSRKIYDKKLLELIGNIFREHAGRYGSPRIWKELRCMEHYLNIKKVARLMRLGGYFGGILKKFRVQTTDSRHNYAISPNLLKQNFKTGKLNEVWLSDITYIRLGPIWVYLCVFMDLYNREIIGWRLSFDLKVDFVIAALEGAMKRRGNPRGVIIHSDRGVQYACTEFRNKIREYAMIQSMSRKGNCYDNAPMESFFHTLKVEEIYRIKNKITEFDELRLILFDYIDRYYNRKRRHSALNYKSPAEYILKIVA